MIEQEPDQFLSRVTGGADNTYFNTFVFHQDTSKSETTGYLRSPCSTTPKRRKPRRPSQRGFEIRFGLALAELEALASPWLPVLLTFLHTRISGQEAVRLQGG